MRGRLVKETKQQESEEEEVGGWVRMVRSSGVSEEIGG